MRVSFEWVDEDNAYPDNHYKVSLARDDKFTDRKSLISKLMVGVMTVLELDDNPHGDTIFFRTVTEKEAESLNDLLDDMRADEWKDEI